MLEILLVYYLGKKIAGNAGDKGYGAVGFVVLLVALWFGGEIAGALFGALLTGGEMAITYLCALLGAATGAVVAFGIVALLPSQRDEDAYALYRPRVRRRRGESRSRPRSRAPEDSDEEVRPPRRRLERTDEFQEEEKPRPRRRPAVEDDEDDPRPRQRRPFRRPDDS